MIAAGFDSWKALGKEDHHGNPHGSQNTKLVPKFRNGVTVHEPQINGRPCRPGQPRHDRDRPDAVPAPDAAEAEHVHDAAGRIEPRARVLRQPRHRRLGPRPACPFPTVPGGEVLGIGESVAEDVPAEFRPPIEVGGRHGSEF